VRPSTRFALVAALLCAAPPFLQAQEARIAFLSPRHLATAIGQTTIELEVTPPAGVEVVRVELQVDGKALRALSAPPWSTAWDAGDGSRGHDLVAVARLSDGTSARASIHTSPLRINQVEEVGLVNLYAIVRSASGAYVSDLDVDAFEVYEDGVRQTIRRFSSERKPLNVGIVLDTSLSMGRGGKLDSARKAALGFLEELAPEDRGMVVTFADDVRVAQDVTSDPALLAQAIEATEARGGTALYDAVWRSSKKLQSFEGRRVLVLLSDGRDEAANGFEPGSLHTRHEAQEQALRSEVMVFSIGLGHDLAHQYPSMWERPRNGSGPGDSLARILRDLAETTGGRALFSPGVRTLRRSFRDVAEDLRHQYTLAYVSTNRADDGTWRRIEVRIPGRRDLDVITRKGYFARGAGTERALLH